MTVSTTGGSCVAREPPLAGHDPRTCLHVYDVWRGDHQYFFDLGFCSRRAPPAAVHLELCVVVAKHYWKCSELRILRFTFKIFPGVPFGGPGTSGRLCLPATPHLHCEPPEFGPGYAPEHPADTVTVRRCRWAACMLDEWRTNETANNAWRFEGLGCHVVCSFVEGSISYHSVANVQAACKHVLPGLGPCEQSPCTSLVSFASSHSVTNHPASGEAFETESYT